MKALLAATIIAATPVHALDVPSGQPVVLHEVLIDAVGQETWLRFRFIAPQIARADGQVDYAAAGGDMAHICAEFALDYMADFDLAADIIVISLADRETEFGQPDPDATQVFDAFRPENGGCIWEGL